MNSKKTKLISDKKLIKILIKDNGEFLVNLCDFNKEIFIDIEEVSKTMQKLKKNECFLRKSVALMLNRAQNYLPHGFKFKVIDGYRPMSAQKIIYRQIFEDIENKNPDWSIEKVEKEANKWVANPKIVPFHTTGGAVDLTILDKDGRELDMGNFINTVDNKSRTDYRKISRKAKNNRAMLIGVMSKVGFVNYPLEWWHWSFGDRYWAAVNKTYSIYGAI